MNIPDPEGTCQPCGNCGQPTVLAEPIPGQRERVHCGTHDHHCHQRGDR